MKKYTLFLASFVFIISLFNFNVDSVSAINCGPGEFFNSSTGQRCVTTSNTTGLGVVMGNVTYESITNGGNVTQVAYNIPLKVTAFGNTLYIGLSAEYEADAGAVDNRLALAFELQDSTAPTIGLENGTVTSTWTCDATIEGGTGYRLDGGEEVDCTLQVIHRTPGTPNRSYRVQINEFQTYTNSALTAGEWILPLEPVQNYQTAYKYIGSTQGSSIAVISPNGGEDWVLGTQQTIYWQDDRVAQYDVFLVDVENNNQQYTIARNVYSSSSNNQGSFSWQVGRTFDNNSVGYGSYKIKVCRIGSTVNCDLSNTAFNITYSLEITTSSPLPNGKVGIYYNKNIDARVIEVNDSWRWSVVSGSLPPGIEFHHCSLANCTSGILSGNSSVAGTYVFAVRVTRGISGSVSTEKQFTLKIDPATTTTTPTISSILPPGCTSSTGNSSTNGQPCTSVYMGDTVSIRGTNFSKKNYAVTYSALNGNIVEMRTKYRSSTLLTAVIPSNAGDGPHGIQLKNRRDNTFISNAVSLNFLQNAPTITVPQISSLGSSSANIGDRVYINGSNFSSSSNVFVDGGAYSPVNGTRMVFPATYISFSKLSFIVTSSVPTGTRTVQVNNGTDTSPILSNLVKLRVTTPPVYIEDKTIDSTTDDTAQVLGAEAFNFTLKLQKGSSGPEVMELQKFLNTVLGASGVSYNLITDGKFGAMTESALIKFQSANGLSADGVVGPLTRAILNK